jgi:hypothetical protein
MSRSTDTVDSHQFNFPQHFKVDGGFCTRDVSQFDFFKPITRIHKLVKNRLIAWRYLSEGRGGKESVVTYSWEPCLKFFFSGDVHMFLLGCSND